ncbi:hypothetical protein ACXWQU_09375, partial [Streptococcus pyogenes]
PAFIRLVEGNEEEKRKCLQNKENIFQDVGQDSFKLIPNSPIAYWLSKNLIKTFSKFGSLKEKFESKNGITSADNDRFLRYWHEVAFD